MSRFLRAFTACALALVLASCESQQPSDTDPTPSGEIPVVPGGGAPPGGFTLPPQRTEAELEALLESEKARIDAAKTASQARYDSLKVEWQAFLDRGGDPRATALLICDPLQYVAETKIIGPEGGDIDFGPHKLRVPAGALPWRAVITAEAPTALQVMADFSPSGTGFNAELQLDLSYQHCVLPAASAPMRTAYIDDALRILSLPRSADDRVQRKVLGWFDHFSKYAVAY
jgi:hypothetical protein